MKKQNNIQSSSRKEKVTHNARINWFQEIRIAFLTSLLFLLFSTAIFWIARTFSPGEFSGIQLRQYLINKLATELNVSPERESIIIEQQLETDASGGLLTDAIVLCGTYCPNGTQLQTGRFISIWERRKLNFLEELFGTNAPYEVSFLQILSEEQFPETFNCTYCKFLDLDCNGSYDIHLKYQSNFADRISIADVFLLQSGDGWKIVAPNFGEIENEISQYLSNDAYVLLDEFKCCSPDKQGGGTEIYSLSMYGRLYRVENPIWGGNDYLYYIAVNNGTTLYDTNYCALVMMRFSNEGKMIREQDWNTGDVYVAPREDVDLNKIVNELWGYRTSGPVFYSEVED